MRVDKDYTTDLARSNLIRRNQALMNTERYRPLFINCQLMGDYSMKLYNVTLQCANGQHTLSRMDAPTQTPQMAGRQMHAHTKTNGSHVNQSIDSMKWETQGTLRTCQRQPQAAIHYQ